MSHTTLLRARVCVCVCLSIILRSARGVPCLLQGMSFSEHVCVCLCVSIILRSARWPEESASPSTCHQDLPAFTMSQLPNQNPLKLPVSYLFPSLVQLSPLPQSLSEFGIPDLLEMHHVIAECFAANALTIKAIEDKIRRRSCKHAAFSLQMEKHLNYWLQPLSNPQRPTFYRLPRTSRDSKKSSRMS